MDRDSLITVAEDLQYLRDGWGPEIPDPDIRRGSATLRRLLIEDTYGQAWRAAGLPRQPKLIAVDIEARVDGVARSDIGCALAVGAHFRGLFAAGVCVVRGSSPPLGRHTPVLRPNGYPWEREYSLSEFVGSPSGFVDGRSFSRRDVVKYVANVKGGVHLSGKGRQRDRDLVQRMSKFEKRITFHTSDGLLLELVAIAQAVGCSDDANRLIAAVAPQSSPPE